ncbi:MAG: bifunctional phosphoribosyl-AMP cyclohydrolase/phosphoribosyl-ATP pyrophosphatase, partial [Dethiobacteria bacterium]
MTNDNLVQKNSIALPLDQLKYDAAGLIPAVIQDSRSGAVLMVGYMNRESLRRTVESGRVW